ncbi:integral membrane protein [Arthrobacter sp. FB24]|nr:integral membrane protein [Arthrobacter sp. FB24]
MSRPGFFEPVLDAASVAGAVWHSTLSRTQAEPPVEPDRQEARRWAVEELAKPVYGDAEPDWLTDLWRQFTEWLRSLGSGDPAVHSGVAVPAIGVTIIVLIAVAILLARPRLNARRRRPDRNDVDADPSISPAEYRRRAAAAAARGEWRTAVVEQFRAIVRAAEERTVIDPRPGRTADEVAGQLAGAFGSHAAALRRAAGVFDGVRYGSAGATAGDHAGMVALDQLLETARPDYGRTTADHLELPR